MERFESVIENVSSMDVKGYEDPVECTRNLEILAKSGEDQYFYKFTGPGVILPETYQKKMLNDCLKLETENAKLKMKSKSISDDNALLLETNKKLKQENEKLENELCKWKREAADCLRTRDEVRREKNKEINELKQHLQQAEIDKRRLTYKLEEKLNLPETPITDAMLADDYLKLTKENEKIKKELSLEKAANEAQRKFIRMYAYAGKEAEVEFNYAIDEVKEVSYVIVEKEMYQSLMDSYSSTIHGTIEDFTVEEHSDQPKTDNVNHPSHYETGKFECIEVMQEVFGITAVCDFCKCNAFKYIYRMDRKNGDEDVRKAIWYLNKYLELSEKD